MRNATQGNATQRRWSLWMIGLLAASAPRTARAIDAQYPAAGVCAWPSVVHVVGHLAPDNWMAQAGYTVTLCSGVYIGNRVVLTAAHCVAQTTSMEVRFGEEYSVPFFTETPLCTAHPDGEWAEVGATGHYDYFGHDIAFCILSSNAPTPPYIPVMIPNGCEAQYLRDRLFGPGSTIYGTDTKYVAVGDEQDPDDLPPEDIEKGTKRFCGGKTLFEDENSTQTIQVISLQPGNEMGRNDAAVGVRPGDSGGALAFPMANGSWRLIGTLSRAYDSFYDLDHLGPQTQIHRLSVSSASAPRYLKWIEDVSGRDVTPCHSWSVATNKWTWTGPANCAAEFDTSPASATTTWPSCSSGTVNTATECSGWTPPGPDNKTAPSEADMLLDVAAFGEWGPTSELFGSDKLPRWIGTPTDDSFTSSTSESNEAFGGRGNDALFVGIGADESHGGPGNDLLVGGIGDDVLVPGRGLDFVQGDLGNDKIVIRGRCELVSGETINGGGGIDTLYSPVNAATLATLGISLTSIESVVLNHPDLELWSCDKPGGTLTPAVVQ